MNAADGRLEPGARKAAEAPDAHEALVARLAALRGVLTTVQLLGLDVKKVMTRRKHRPMFFIDIAVPRDIEPAVNDVDNAYLYNVDDLQSVVDANVKERRKEAEKAERLVDQEVGTFEKWIASLQVVPTIVQLRRQVDALRVAELEKSLGKLQHLGEKDREQVALAEQALESYRTTGAQVAAIAARTKRMKISSAVTVLSSPPSTKPVRAERRVSCGMSPR